MSEGGCGCCGKPAKECFCVITNVTGSKADLLCTTHAKAWYAKLPGSGPPELPGRPGWVKA